MNTKAEQNSQKGTKDLNTISKHASGKLMDNILSGNSSNINKKTQQSKLEPEYLSNILIDLNDASQFKNKHKLNVVNGLLKTSERAAAAKVTSDETSKKAANVVNSILGRTDSKRPKSGIKRRLKKLIESKKRTAAEEDDAVKMQVQAHTSKQQHAKMTKNVLIKDEAAANNVQQISNAQPPHINNTPTSIIAESNKREPKHKKTKKESKKKELKDKGSVAAAAAVTNPIEHTPPDLLKTDKKQIKYKDNNSNNKPKANKKNASITSCPPSILAKTSAQSQQSKKIKLIVNQIATNLKQSGRFELNTGNIKRDIYIKGLSTCMTSQALEQINRILNPPRVAACKANLTAAKTNNTTSTKSQNNTSLEENSRPTTSQKDRMQISKINIANEINTFNKQQHSRSPSPPSPPSSPPPLPPLPPPPIVSLEQQQYAENRAKQFPLPMLHKEKPKDKELIGGVAAAEDKHPLSVTQAMTSQEQELIKKINEKIDKIISSGLSETLNTSTSSLTPEETKNPVQVQPPQPPPPLSPPVKTVEPPKFMQAPIIKKVATPTPIIGPSFQPILSGNITNQNKLSREPRANESPPQTAQPHIKNILNVVRNSEIVNEIKQNTITVLQNAISKNIQQLPIALTAEKPNKMSLEKKSNSEEEKKKQQETSKTVPSLKKFQFSNDRIIQIHDRAARQHASLNNVRKPSKNFVPSSSLSTAGNNRPIVMSTHLAKNTSTSATNGTNSSSTLNLIAALSSSKKFSLLSPMEVVQDFVNLVNHAKRNRKTFTICGNFYSLRRAFAERGWIEKMRINIMDDRETWRKIESLSNFELVDGMRSKDFGEKYRRVFLTKLLAGHQVDFYWDYLTNPFTVNNDKIKRTLINRFPYGATRAYTSKHGLTESLRDAHWYCIEGYANIFYPRTYNLSMIEETTSFVEDFRITAVISLLQWIVSNMTTPEKILSPSGDVPTSVYNFATIQCHNYIKMKEHKDIDEVIPQAKDYEWEVFLEKFYKIVHNENCFKSNERISAQLMIEQSKYVLKKVKKYLPNLHLDGFKNMWLLKPNNGSRGCGIHVCRTLKYMMDTVNTRKDIKYVVQKYLERPLLIHKTKFDIRQWFLVTCMPSVKVWLYKECYLRFSSQMFDLNKLHESIHLTNNSVQCRYKNNNQRSTSLPEQNMWDSETFKKYLTEIGQPYAWRNNIYKGMKECLIALFMLCQSKMELRINSFELCGADFMLSEDYHPYLIEINSRPALYASTKITARMCPKVLEDVIKVTVDHARNPKASTGDFELIYTDSFNYSIPRNVNNLYVEGMSYFSKFIETKPSAGVSSAIVPIQPAKEVKNDSIKKILNIEPDVVKIDVRNTLEKILAVVHNDSNSKIKESPEERNKKFRSMLSEFVNIISNVKNVNEEV